MDDRLDVFGSIELLAMWAFDSKFQEWVVSFPNAVQNRWIF